MSVYVARTGKFVTAEMVQALVDLGFKQPLSHKRPGFSPATVGRMLVSPKHDEHADMYESPDGVHETVHEACVCFLGLSCHMWTEQMWTEETTMQGVAMSLVELIVILVKKH